MMLALLAAATAATAAAAQPDRTANWLKRPTPEQIRSVWPIRAIRRGVSGKAEISCRVNVHGLTEDCQVISETPPGEGFGAAALMLTPQFVFKPAIVHGEPTPSQVRFPVNFVTQGPVPGPNLGSVAMIGRPVWIAAPTFADVGAVYPGRAGGTSGYVSFRCELKKTGELKNCDLIREEPAGKGFADAGRKLLPRFRTVVTPAMQATHDAMQVDVPIRLIDPLGPEFANRRMGEPIWANQLDPTVAQKLFPAKAVARGVKTGLGVAVCTVTPQGMLTQCEARPGVPDGLGFSDVTTQIAERLRISVWTQEGGPVDGVKISLPIRFNLAATETPSKTEAAAPTASP
jgi:TonB family protein